MNSKTDKRWTVGTLLVIVGFVGVVIFCLTMLSTEQGLFGWRFVGMENGGMLTSEEYSVAKARIEKEAAEARLNLPYEDGKMGRTYNEYGCAFDVYGGAYQTRTLVPVMTDPTHQLCDPSKAK